MPIIWKQEPNVSIDSQFSIDFHVAGPLLYDVPVDVYLAEWTSEDLHVDFDVIAMDTEDFQIDFYVAQEVLEDSFADIYTALGSSSDLLLDFALSARKLLDFLLDIDIESSTVLKDMFLDIDVNDGTSLNDFMIDVRLISKKPTFKMAYGLGLTSVIKEV